MATTGSSDIACVGRVSTSGNSSSVDQHPPASHIQNKAAIIAGVTVPVVATILLMVLVVWWRMAQARKAEESSIPSPYVELAPFYPKRNSIVHTTSSKMSYMPNSMSRGSPMSHLITFPQLSGTMSEVEVNTPPELGALTPLPPIPRRSSRRSRSRLISEIGTPNINIETNNLNSDREIASSETPIIFQHRDGGSVHELPPPYPDRNIRIEHDQGGQSSNLGPN